MSHETECNGLQEIIDKVLEEMRLERGGGELDLKKLNLAEFSRRTGLSRSKARTLRDKGFRVTPHGRCGLRAQTTVMTGYTRTVDDLLSRGVTNSTVCFDRIRAQGYEGGLTTVKDYIAAHRHLVPAKRKLAASEPQGSRGRRYETAPGECFQMDWGFVNVEDASGALTRIACFAMVCHHCGECYVEFFTNARQENLFIGMAHAFLEMGVPERVLTDNMKSVVIGRDADGRPVWQGDYAEFMRAVGFSTTLCKPRHPFTKGKVERLIRFVKGNFLAGRSFTNIIDLNDQALEWCAAQGARYRRAVDCVPSEEHASACLAGCRPADESVLEDYLCPVRKISFDGFVNYEGRRFGVPYWYGERACRVNREGRVLHIYSLGLDRELAAHDVTWGRRDSRCEDQYADLEPVELPTAPVRTVVKQAGPAGDTAFTRFDFARGLW